MHLPNPLRRQGVVPGLARLISLILECISVVTLALEKDPYREYTTDYVIVSAHVFVAASGPGKY